jgi:hypothetical protein
VSLLGFCVVIVAAAGGGVAISTAMRGLDQWANAPQSQVERVASQTPAVAAPRAAVLPDEPPQVVAVADGEPAREAIKPRTAERTPKPAKTQKPLLPELGAPQPKWEQQQQEYELARTAYDASERAEGFRWAQQYKVRMRRYCRDLEKQRTAAFMEGCLQYAAGVSPPAADPG